MDANTGATSSKKSDRKGKQVYSVEENVDKGNQKKLTREEVNALLAMEQKKWEKAKAREINEQNRRRNEKQKEKEKAAKERTRKRTPGPCYLCQGQHHIKDCPDMARLRQGTGGSGGASTSQGN